MIESRGRPTGRRVTLQTCVGEQVGSMIRVIRFTVIGFVARPAIRRCAGILTVDVALRAAHADMSAGEREVRQVVIELRRLPAGCCVALLTRLREVAGNVIRVFRSLIVGLMARPAVGRRPGILTVVMALRTGQTDVRAGQREVSEIMIKLRRLPGVRRVALEALMSKF